MEPLKLTHTILYTKGWYKINETVKDLIITLRSDGYTARNEKEVAMILVSNLERSKHPRIGSYDLLSSIEGKATLRRMMGQKEGIDFNRYSLVIDFCIELMFNLNNDEWVKGKPNYSDVLPES